jgi:hypothetical protein
MPTITPTPSSPGIRVVPYGAGQTLQTVAQLASYTAAQNLVAAQEMLIIECYEGFALTANLRVGTSSTAFYCIIRPVPGLAENDFHPDGPFDVGTEGLAITVSSNLKIQRGVVIEGFRVNVIGSGVMSFGGPNPNGASLPAAICGIRRSRIVADTSNASCVAMGEYNIGNVFTDNLVVRVSGVSTVGSNTSTTFSRNTFVALNDAVGAILNTTSSARIENNAFVNVGDTPYVGTSGTISGNYTNIAMATARAGFTVDTVNPFVVSDTSDFRPAAGSPLLGNATDSAKSINDARGNNRGLDPDVGAVQLVPAVPLPTGSITSQPAPDGQTMDGSFTYVGVVDSITVVAAPADTTSGAQINNGTATFAAGAGTYSLVDIEPGNYTFTITLFNSGGSAVVSGTQPFSVIGISGEPAAAMEGDEPVPSSSGELNVTLGAVTLASQGEAAVQAPVLADLAVTLDQITVNSTASVSRIFSTLPAPPWRCISVRRRKR